MLPQIGILLAVILLIAFVSTGGIDDLPENISIFIMGAVVGAGLVFIFK